MTVSSIALIPADRLAHQLRTLGLRSGDSVLVHSAFKSLGIQDPEEILHALLAVLGPSGVLLMPALSYNQQPPHLHDTRHTRSCVGFLSEYFRTRTGTLRSLHPTHSVCALGARAPSMLERHLEDATPCGPHSPFRRLMEGDGKILMLGCGLRPNTAMHAIEELAPPPYLFGPEREYIITDGEGRVFRKRYRTHDFSGYEQRYERVADLLRDDQLRTSYVGDAWCHLLNAAALKECALAKLREDPLFFVERDAKNVS
jgi:aminoglycoside 3-N-acetyltransferase